MPPLERADGIACAAVRRLVGHHAEQVPRLAAALRQGQRAQRLDPTRLVAGGVGEAGDRSLLLRVPAGGLPAVGVHDARPRRGGGQPVERLPRAESGGPHGPATRQAIEERHGFPAADEAPRTLAHRHQLREPARHVLLPDHDPRWLQPVHRALGDSHFDDTSRTSW